ncbi:MAG TPA: hypothetical protein VEH27_13965 [Methylomirabilota bacterium]|nr:hypothetical protein [Methylomirabilota bacterium]
MPEKTDIGSLYPQQEDVTDFTLAMRRAKAMADVATLLAGSLVVSASGNDVSTLTPIAANANRRKWFIKNTGTNVLTVTFGGASIDLKPGLANNDGGGAEIEDLIWKGAVTVSGTSPRYSWAELV